MSALASCSGAIIGEDKPPLCSVVFEDCATLMKKGRRGERRGKGGS